MEATVRIIKIWYAVLFLRLWRYWLKEKGYSISENFISLNAYICIELNAHALLLMILKCKQTPEIFKPWLMSSQPCERTFRATRSLTSTFSTIVNFSMLEILYRINKIQTINDIMSELCKYNQ